MTSHGKRIVILVISLVSLIGLVGCGQSSDKQDNNKKLTKEEKINKGLDAFYNMRNGKIHIDSKLHYVNNRLKDGDEGEKDLNNTVDASFEMGPLLVRGKIKQSIRGKVKRVKGSMEYYGTDLEEYRKEDKDKNWKQKIYAGNRHKLPVGFNKELIDILRTKKKDITVTQNKNSYTLHFETDDVKFLSANSDIFFGAVYTTFYVNDLDESGKATVDLTVSKDGSKPISIRYSGNTVSNLGSKNFRSTVKYSKQNTGVRVNEPKGIDKAKGI